MAIANTRDFARKLLFFRRTECTSGESRFVRVINMSKAEGEGNTEMRSAFFERRRLRRIRMIVELTQNLISSDLTVSHREAQCLVNCARKAILELQPQFADRYERVIRPHFERILSQRWPGGQSLQADDCELIN